MTSLISAFEDLSLKRLSLAIQLQDGFSKAEPLGELNIALIGQKSKGMISSGSFFIYCDLSPGNYQATVRSENYFFAHSPVLTAPQDLGSIWVAELLPLPSYPFPPGVTLIRGFLRRSSGELLSGARLSWMSGNALLKGATTDKGEFVIYFGALSEDDVVKSGDLYYVKGDAGGTKLKINIEYQNSTKYYYLDRIVVGKTNLFNLFILKVTV